MQDPSKFYNDEIRLKDVIVKVRQLKIELFARWKFIFIISLLFALIGVLYAMKKHTNYKAELNFVVEDNSGGAGMLGKYSGIASQFGFDLGGGGSTTFSEANILELLTSRRVVEGALLSEVSVNGEKDLLINYHLKFNNYRELWFNNTPEIKNLFFNDDRNHFTLLHDSVLYVAWKNISENVLEIQLNDQSNIISVTCQSKNELFAKLLAENIVAEVKEFYTYTQTAKARNSLEFIQNRADSVLNELKLAELSYARHKDSNFGMMRAQDLLEEMRLKREVEILNVMYGEIIKNLEISKVTLLNQKPLINIIDNPRLPLEEIRFSAMKGLLLFGLFGAILTTLYITFAYLIKDALAVS